MSALSSIGVAVVGTGFMGGAHTEALRRLGVQVRGICGSSQEKSQAAAEQLGLPRGYASYHDVLADGDVHAVHIGTPNRWHYEMARAALKAGKHVMCEKPLAMNSQESQALVELAAARPQQAAGVNHNIRFYPLCHEARELIASGSLGEVFHITGSYVQDWLLWPTDYNWRLLREVSGPLRAIADIGTHWLDLVQFVSGLEVEAVCADLHTVHATRRRPLGEVATFQTVGKSDATEEVAIDTDDYGAVLLRFRGGARGVMHVSQVTAGRKNCLRFEIAGAEQSLAFDSERPNELWIGRRDQPNGLLLKDPALLSPPAQRLAAYPGGHNEGYADTFTQCFRDFYESIAAGELEAAAPFPTFADGHCEILLCEAILRSHQEQGWIEL